MRLFGVRRLVPQHESFTCNLVNDLDRGGSLHVRIAASTAVVLLVIASAGFGCSFAYTQGAHQGTTLAILAVCMALGLECAKPFAVEAVFSSLQSWAIGRGLAMLLLAVVTIGYSLTAELSLMAMTRSDAAASRSKAAELGADDKADLERIVTERQGMTFTPATEAGVSAAREAVAAAARTREAECAKRGPNCRLRETEESTARASLARVLDAKAATDRAKVLDARAAEIRARLAQSPAMATADPGAAALATYLAAVAGLNVDSSLLAQWLVLVGVLALEVGSALSVLLVHAAGAAPARRQIRPVAPVQEFQPPAVAGPQKAAAAPPDAPVQATVQVSREQRSVKKSKRGRPPRERKEAEAKIIDMARANGGRLSKNSVRKLGQMVSASRGTAHNALLGLIAAGVIAKTAAGLVLTA